MSRPPLRRVEELFHQAVSLPPEEQAAFLTEACAGDADLRSAVEDLLEHDRAGFDNDGFLRSPLDRDASESDPDKPTRADLRAERESAAPPLPSVPGYVVLEEIGRGGMGVVYKARQISLDRLVALKMLLGGAQASAESMGRFRTEAESLARLHHPHIVPIYEFGEHEGRPYFTMGYIAGPSLADFLAGRPQDFRAAARLIEILARTIHAAHQCGVIHRDLKPANILLAGPNPPSDGKALSSLDAYDPRITDFGLAKDQTTDRQLTRTGTSMGTPCYMAPEQVHTRRGGVGPAADVYALGSILYEMLTGRPPFDAASPALTISELVMRDPLPPSKLRPRLPRDLETICLKCLEKSPRRRYESALDLAEDLRRFQAGDPIAARPVGAWERMVRWCLRQPLVASLLGTIAVLLVTFLSTVVVYNARLQNANALLEEALGKEHILAEERRKQVIELNITIGVRAEQGGDSFTAVLRFLEALRLNEGQAERETALRKRIARALRNCPRLVHLLIPDRPMLCAALPPSGGRLAVIGADHAVEILDVETGRRISPILPHKAAPLGGAFSADGRRLATISPDGAVGVWEVESAAVRWVRPEKGKVVAQVAFDPDGQVLLTRNDQARIRLWRLTGPASEPNLKLAIGPPVEAIAHAALSDDGRWLFTVDKTSAGQLWDVSAAKALTAPMPVPPAATPTAIGADGRLVALIDPDGTVRVWDVGNSGLIDGRWDARKGVSFVRFSPDGERILTLGNAARIWSTRTGALLAESWLHERALVGGGFSPDGRKVISRDEAGGVWVWDAATGKPLTPPLRHAGRLALGSFSADGKQFLVVGAWGAASVWEWPSGQDLALDNRPFAELELLARILACGYVDEKQQHHDLGPEELRSAWEHMQASR